MALTVVKVPPRVHFVGNGLPFQFATDNLWQTEGQKFYRIMRKDNPLLADETIVFEWSDIEVTFTAKATPDDSGLQIPAGADNDAICSAIMANYLISKDFYFSVSGTELIMEARSEGADYELSITLNTSAYTLYGSYNEGISAVRHPFFAILAQAVSNNSILGTDKIVPGNDQKVIFDPADLVAAWFDYSFEWPIANIFVLKTGFICPYIVRAAEQYGAPAVAKKMSSSTTFYAMPGAISDNSLQSLNAADQSWWERISYNRQFVSFSPSVKLSSVNVPEKLWFLCWHAFAGSSFVKVDIVLTDGTTATFNSSTVSMSRFQVYELNVGYSALGIQAFIDTYHAGKFIAKWSVSLYCGAQVVSETKSFLVDPRSHVFEHIFVFKNTYGAYEALRTTGKAIVKNTIAREQFNNGQPIAFDTTARQKYSRSTDFSESFEVSSGYLYSYAEAAFAADAFRSDDIVEIVDGVCLPVVILSDEITIRKDGDSRFYFVFEMAYAFNATVFPNSSVPEIGGDFNEDFSDDFNI